MKYTLAAVAVNPPKKGKPVESEEKGAAALVKCQRFTLVWCARCHVDRQDGQSLRCRKKAGLVNVGSLLSHYS